MSYKSSQVFKTYDDQFIDPVGWEDSFTFSAIVQPTVLAEILKDGYEGQNIHNVIESDYHKQHSAIAQVVINHYTKELGTNG